MILKMDYWSPKHVELLNVMNKINHQILCILLDYTYILQNDTRSLQYQTTINNLNTFNGAMGEDRNIPTASNKTYIFNMLS